MSPSEELKIKGNEAFSQKEFKKAAKIYRDAIKLDPGNPVLYSNRAMCFIKLNDWKRAIDDCVTGLKIYDIDNKTRIKLYWRYSTALIETDDLTNALNILNKAYKLDPTNQILKANRENVQNKLLIRSKKRKRENSEAATYEDVLIEIVDDLPPEFQKQSQFTDKVSFIKKKESIETNDELNSQLANIGCVIMPKNIEVQSQKAASSNQPESKNIFNSEKYPETPTVYFLSSLLKKLDNHDYYIYILQINTDYYKNLFKSGGIDSDFLSFYIEAATEYTSNLHNKELLNNIANCLKLFPVLPRFKIASMFLPPAKVKKLVENIEHSCSLSLKDLWN